MPMVPEAAIAMLAYASYWCGALCGFGGFPPDSLASRIEDCQNKTGNYCGCGHAW